MDQITYEHQNNKNYMIIQAKDKVSPDQYQMNMLMQNQIIQILGVHIRKIDTNNLYYYDISSKQRMTKLYEYTKIKWEDFKMICLGCLQVMKMVNEYMLDLEHVVFMPECMYIDIKDKTVWFAYYPFYEEEFYEQLRLLFEYILEHYDHSESRQQLMQVYELYQRVMNQEFNQQSVEQILSFEDVEEIHNSEEESLNNNLDDEDSSTLKETCSVYSSQYKWQNTNRRIITEIPEEVLVDQKEKQSKSSKRIYQLVVLLAIISILTGIMSLFFHSYALIKLGVLGGIICIAIGVMTLVAVKELHKKGVGMTAIKTEKKEQPYEVSQYDLKDAFRNVTKELEMASKEKELQTQKTKKTYPCNTMLLKDYHKSTFTEMRLVYQSSQMTRPLGIKTEGFIECINIDTTPFVIGNIEESCNIIIAHPLISRMHACIRKVQDGFVLEDLNSTNGTFHNGSRLFPEEQVPLQDGDVIGLAMLTYKVEIM
jgi:hypothetical protein